MLSPQENFSIFNPWFLISKSSNCKAMVHLQFSLSARIESSCLCGREITEGKYLLGHASKVYEYKKLVKNSSSGSQMKENFEYWTTEQSIHQWRLGDIGKELDSVKYDYFITE